jgi:hypothetical protein
MTDQILLDNPGPFKSPQARNQFIANHIPAFLEAGYSQQDILKSIRQSGLSISNAAFRDIYIKGLQTYYQSEAIQHLTARARITEDVLAKSKRSQLEPYKFVVQGSFIDQNTGEIFQNTFFVDTDQLGTKKEIEEFIIDAINNGAVSGEKSSIVVKDLAIIRGYKA